MSHNELLRIVRLSPYRRGAGPSLSLRLYDTNRVDYAQGAKCILHADATCRGHRYAFEFCASPMHSVDSDEAVRAAITWALHAVEDAPEDWRNLVVAEHGEAFACEAETRFGSH